MILERRFFGAKVSSITMSLGLELEKDQVTMNKLINNMK